MIRAYHQSCNCNWICYILCGQLLTQFYCLISFLDKFWMHQDVLYAYTADLTGIGDRSVHVTKDV